MPMWPFPAWVHQTLWRLTRYAGHKSGRFTFSGTGATAGANGPSSSSFDDGPGLLARSSTAVASSGGTIARR
jgi:hypothetical protein